MSVKESHEILINDESDKLIEQDKIIKAAKLLLKTTLFFLMKLIKFQQEQTGLVEMYQEKVCKEICCL